MKKIISIVLICTSFLFSDSGDSVGDLADKHENANDYHSAQKQAFDNSKTILSKTLLTQGEHIFELEREANLIYSQKLSEGIYEEMKTKKYMFKE
jgi:hypothetical protein